MGGHRRKRRVRLVVALALAAVAVLGLVVMDSADRQAPGPVARQMWVWHADAPRSVVAVAREYEVTRLLMWVWPGFTQDPGRMAYLVELQDQAAAAGLHVDALSGDPTWAHDPEAVRIWADEVRRSGLFERLHLDIESHGSLESASERTEFADGLVEALRAARSAGMPVDADVAYWYDEIATSEGEPLDGAVLGVADSVTVMAYRDSASEVLSIAEDGLALGSAFGKPVWIGINTGPTDGDPRSASYEGQAVAVVKRDIEVIQAKGRRWSSFAGLALHDSRSLAKLADT